MQKYLVAPAAMPEYLNWLKWESYTTWLSGAELLMVVYWAGSGLFLIYPAKMGLSAWQAITIPVGFLAVGWMIYDGLCKSKLGEYPSLLKVLLFTVLVVIP